MRRSSFGVVGLSALLLAVVVGCSSAGSSTGAGGDWSRRYVHSYDRVWRAVVKTLSDGGYYLEEVDPERGQIRAESASDRAYRGVVLDVRVDERQEMVRVSVLASGGAASSPARYKRIERAVMEFLGDLDDELSGPPTEG